MKDTQFKLLMNILKEINQKLSVLITLQKSSAKPPKLGTEENIVLKLCNGKNSVNDIMTATKKTRNNVKKTLSNLRKKGLIRTTTINKKTVYVKF